MVMWQSDLFDDSEKGEENVDDSHLVNVNKRRRITQACEPCRRKKSKCDGAQPCSICQSLDRHCQYGTANRRRGLPAGYVRSIEILLGSALQQNRALEGDLRSTLRNKFADIRFTEGDVAEGLLETWRKSDTAKDVEALLSYCQDVEANGKVRHDELSKVSPYDFLPVLSADNQNIITSQTHNAVSQVHVTFSQEPISERQVANSGFLRDLESSSHLQEASGSDDRSTTVRHSLTINGAADMVDFYFLHTHCWFPMLDRSVILRLLHSNRLSNEGFVPHSDDLVALWAILAYSSVQMKACNILPDTNMTPEDIYSTARSLIPSEEHEYKIQHIQALVLLALVKLGSNTPEKAWILLGQCARMLEIANKEEIPTSKSAYSYGHLQKFCAFLDTVTAATLERTPYFASEELLLTGTLEEDGLDEWSTWNPHAATQNSVHPQSRVLARSISVFNSLFALGIILGKILKPSKAVTFEETISELRMWRKDLPEHCQLEDGHAATPAVAHLHLAWICTVSSLQKRLQGGIRPDLTTHLRSEEFSEHLTSFLQGCIDDFGGHTLPSTFVIFLTYLLRLAPYTVLSQLSQNAFSVVQANVNGTLKCLVSTWRPLYPSTVASTSFDQALYTSAKKNSSRITTVDQNSVHQVTPIANLSWLPGNPAIQVNLPDIEFPEIPDLELEGVLPAGDFESLLQEIGPVESITSVLDPEFMQNLGFAADTDMSTFFTFLHSEPGP